jgi:hypothetical protein
MPYRNSITHEYSEERPFRVRLDDGMTRTGEAITDEMLADAGWVYEDPIPHVEPDFTIPDNWKI